MLVSFSRYGILEIRFFGWEEFTYILGVDAVCADRRMLRRKSGHASNLGNAVQERYLLDMEPSNMQQI